MGFLDGSGSSNGENDILRQVNQYVVPFDVLYRKEKKTFSRVAEDIMRIMLSYAPRLNTNPPIEGWTLEDHLGGDIHEDIHPDVPTWDIVIHKKKPSIMVYKEPDSTEEFLNYVVVPNIRSQINEDWSMMLLSLVYAVNLLENPSAANEESALREIYDTLGWAAFDLRKLVNLHDTYIAATKGKKGLFELYRDSA